MARREAIHVRGNGSIRPGALLPFCLVLSAIFVPSFTIAAESSPEIEAILADFATRRERWRTFEYQVEGTVRLAAGAHGPSPESGDGPGQPIPPEPLEYPVHNLLMLDLDHQRARREETSSIFHTDIGKYVPRYDCFLFDSTGYQIFTPREKNTSPDYTPSAWQPDLRLTGAGCPYPFLGCDMRPILLSHGFLWVLLPDQLGQIPTAAEFDFGGTVRIDSQSYDVLSRSSQSPNRNIKSTWEYWIDRSKHSAVRRVVYKHNDRQLHRVDIEYENSSGEWLAHRWRMYWGDQDPTSFESREFTVQSRKLGPKLDQRLFFIIPQAGQVVDEGDDNTYLVGLDGERIFYNDDPKLIVLSDQSVWHIIACGFAFLTGMACLAGGFWWRFHSR